MPDRIVQPCPMQLTNEKTNYNTAGVVIPNDPSHLCSPRDRHTPSQEGRIAEPFSAFNLIALVCMYCLQIQDCQNPPLSLTARWPVPVIIQLYCVVFRSLPARSRYAVTTDE